MYGFLELENGGLEWLPNDVGFVPKPEFGAEKLAFNIFYNPSMCTYARVYVCMHEACTRRSKACVHICMYAYTYPRVSMVFLFQK